MGWWPCSDCCGGGNPCSGCSGTVPNNMQVVFSGIANCGSGCSDCSNLDGTYVVPYQSDCNFLGCFNTSPTYPTAGGIVVRSFEIQVAIFGLFGTYYIDVNYGAYSSIGCPGSTAWGGTFRSTSFTIPSCSFSSYNIPYSSSTGGCDFSGATCTITTL